MNPGFSERTFEFCFNAEYCQANAALLASHPHIPSQQLEKDLGYDVEFRLRQGRYTRSVFFQHKVSSFAEHRAGRNARFYDCHNGPYFRFSVDNEQHNTLCALSRTKGNAFYCAPRFHLSHELEARFRAVDIAAHAVLLDPLDVGEILDRDRHNITYCPAGMNATLHSDPRPFKQTYAGARDRSPHLRENKIDEEYVESLSDELLYRTRDSKFRSALTREVERASPVKRAQIILGRVYQVTWLLLP
ncbi:adenylosuccinate lyase [Billgrantia endophytica]|uniref:Adenylosuccinate lyase n=1 Tax=Billgrantia endophytica TaxID=2033802 RepID=A0A2N7TV94_9GAMM|nr:adenylosuccinate lyase [Halomonas endophytica]PMR72068.1 adenylosuccinate lyase [Halomonas endophytica]